MSSFIANKLDTMFPHFEVKPRFDRPCYQSASSKEFFGAVVEALEVPRASDMKVIINERPDRACSIAHASPLDFNLATFPWPLNATQMRHKCDKSPLCIVAFTADQECDCNRYSPR